MTTQQRTSIQAGVDSGANATGDSHRACVQPASLATAADWRLQLNAVIWRMQRQADEALATPAQLRETLRDSARALEQLRSSVTVAARTGEPAQQTHQDGAGRSSDQQRLDRLVLDVAYRGVGRHMGAVDHLLPAVAQGGNTTLCSTKSVFGGEVGRHGGAVDQMIA